MHGHQATPVLHSKLFIHLFIRGGHCVPEGRSDDGLRTLCLHLPSSMDRCAWHRRPQASREYKYMVTSSLLPSAHHHQHTAFPLFFSFCKTNTLYSIKTNGKATTQRPIWPTTPARLKAMPSFCMTPSVRETWKALGNLYVNTRGPMSPSRDVCRKCNQGAT